ncbi:MAG TPA: extracellular solute-binding protein [Anaerolineales bacterium]|nr:extracellular solute-binding protein [Anaerolineales bacterium]
MTELNFLAIADAAEDLNPLHDLLRPFERNEPAQIRIKRIDWERAWQTLLIDAVEGKGPHVSQIGSTWGATMAMFDALRFFTSDEVARMGGAAQFLPAAWETVKLASRSEVWSIPWTVYTFVLYYRRDLLKSASIDLDEAFTTPAAMCETFARLSQKGLMPWAFPTLHHYQDLVHIASSWVRAYGGEFLAPNGYDPAFGKPEARRGLMEFFELFSYLPPSLRGLSVEACTQAFARGETALMIGGIEIADELLASPYTSQELRENLAVTTLPGVPWIGGDHLVIWKNVRTDLELERVALDLVQYLSACDTQVQFFKSANVLPARLDAYAQIDFSLDTSTETMQKILKTGRPHPPVRLWRRIEAFLEDMLQDIGNAVLRQPTSPAAETAERMIIAYQEKLSAVLKG